MRNERQMTELILGVARDDERIRTVIMNGSRANPQAPIDIFQDYDIVYVVQDVGPFKHDRAFLELFGKLMILQCPNDMMETTHNDHDPYAFLMQFADGNRIDLTLWPSAKELRKDSQSILLLDKDGTIKPFPPASDKDYLPHPPTAKAYLDCCNEFWWVSPYAAKGLWREEILYAKAIQELDMRPQLLKMLEWDIGIRTGFTRNPGKSGKYFKHYLEPEVWDRLMATYADASYASTWDAIEKMAELFHLTALTVAAHYGFDYIDNDDRNVTAHLKHVRALPKDAQTIY